jgi:hypothetical protein
MKANGTARPIKAEFYDRNDKPIKVIRGKYPRTMMMRAFDHMQVDDYGAYSSAVYDLHGAGTLHGSFRLKLVNGKIKVETLYERDPRKFIDGGRS